MLFRFVPLESMAGIGFYKTLLLKYPVSLRLAFLEHFFFSCILSFQCLFLSSSLFIYIGSLRGMGQCVDMIWFAGLQSLNKEEVWLAMPKRNQNLYSTQTSFEFSIKIPWRLMSGLFPKEWSQVQIWNHTKVREKQCLEKVDFVHNRKIFTV